MNLEVLHQRISAPHSIQPTEIEALRDLTVKYPFAQVFSILYLKALVLNQDLNFDEELQKHAYRITDRAKLYELLQERNVSAAPTGQTGDKQEEIIESSPVSDEEVQTEVFDLPAGRQEESNDVIKKEETPQQEEEIRDPLAQAVPEGSQELEKEMLAHVIASAYSLEMELEDESREEESNKPVIDTSQARSFTSWLKLADDESAKITSNVAKTKEMLEHLKEVELNKKKETTPASLPAEGMAGMEKSPTPKKEFFSPSKTARESVQEDKLMYSETLANIFAAQGNYPKAILAFEQLMLINPEKKLYFAKKIKELKLKLDT